MPPQEVPLSHDACETKKGIASRDRHLPVEHVQVD